MIGVYIFYDKEGNPLYIGKARDIKERVKSHFRASGFRESLFLKKVKKIGFKKTDSEIEALLLEAKLIKELQPKFNVLWKDDKNYFYVAVTKEEFPRVFLTHQIKAQNSKLKISFVGPFVDGRALKLTLKILRRVFPYRTCKPFQGRPCMWHQLGLCPGSCALKKSQTNPKFKIIKKESQRNAKAVLDILQGKKNQVLKNLKKEMIKLAKNQEYERAAKIRDQIESLEKTLQNVKIFSPEKKDLWEKTEKELRKILKTRKRIFRIEGYDVSNIQGQMATGAMAVFEKGLPEKSEYRKFKIKIAKKPNDIAMLKETLERRFNHLEWKFPQVILIDGGKAQLNAAIETKCQKSKLKSLNIMALAKRKNELFIEGKKKPVLLKSCPQEVSNLILYIRDEAHRFAIGYHRKLRIKEFLA